MITQNQRDRSSDKARHARIYEDCLPLVEDFAWRTLHVKERPAQESVFFCIDVDSHWKAAADYFEPNRNWQKVRDDDLEPILIGVYNWEICEVLIGMYPILAQKLLQLPKEGQVKFILLTNYTVEVCELQPKAHKVH